METTDVWSEIKTTFVEAMVLLFLTELFDPRAPFPEKVLQFAVMLLIDVLILVTFPLFLAFCVRSRLKHKEDRVWKILKGEEQ